MRTIKFTSWQDDNFFIGFINEYPDYQTQGMKKEEPNAGRGLLPRPKRFSMVEFITDTLGMCENVTDGLT